MRFGRDENLLLVFPCRHRQISEFALGLRNVEPTRRSEVVVGDDAIMVVEFSLDVAQPVSVVILWTRSRRTGR